MPRSTRGRPFRVRRALACLVLASGAAVVVLGPGEGAAAGPPPVLRIPGTFTLPTPVAGNVTLAHVVFEARPQGGSLPADVAAHIYLTAGGGLTGAAILTGGATPTRTANAFRYDAFLALIDRAGGPPVAHPVAFDLGLVGLGAGSVRVTTPSFAAVRDALGAHADEAFCRAIARDVAHPAAVAFIDARASDPPLAAGGRLALAQATSRLCDATTGAAATLDALLAKLGPGAIGASTRPGASTTTAAHTVTTTPTAPRTTPTTKTTTTTVGTTTAPARTSTTGTTGAGGFTPAALAGTWTGTWTNHTFNTTGTLTLQISGTSTLDFTATLTGNTFGCTTPAPATYALSAGSGDNHWNANGFTIAQSSDSFGTFSVTYAYPAGTLTGGGQNPSCAPGLSWTITGTFTGNSFSAQISIQLSTGPATSSVSLTRS